MTLLDRLLKKRSQEMDRDGVGRLLVELEEEGFQPVETIKAEDGQWVDVWFKEGMPDIMIPEEGIGRVWIDEGVPMSLSFLLNFVSLTTQRASSEEEGQKGMR